MQKEISIKLILSIFIVLFYQSIYAQIDAPKYSNEFLSIGIGARAFGMSQAQVSNVNDVTAAYWNPAGLNQIKTKYDIGLMHAEYFAGIAKYDYAGFATRLDSNSVIAASIIRFGIDDIADTRFLFDNNGNANGKLNYNNIKFFSAADYAFLVSYGRKSNLIEGLTLGATFKVVHRIVGNFATAWGFGLDAGAQLTRGKWLFGLMARDVTGTFNAWSINSDLLQPTFIQTGNEIPTNSVEVTLPKLIPGISRSFLIKQKFGVLVAADLITTFDGKRNTAIKTNFMSIDPVLGLELDYKKIVYVRMGIGNIQQVKNFNSGYSTTIQPNFGVGIRLYKFTIDYALTDLGNLSESLYSNVFSLRFNFDKLK